MEVERRRLAFEAAPTVAMAAAYRSAVQTTQQGSVVAAESAEAWPWVAEQHTAECSVLELVPWVAGWRSRVQQGCC